MMREVPKASRTRFQRITDGVGHVLDNVTLALSPRRARRRFKDRIRAQQLSLFEGAQRGRFHGSWKTSSGSADDDLSFSGSREEMVKRSRELSINDPHAASIFRVLDDNIVGPGIRAQSRARAEETGLTKAQVDAWNRACDDFFNAYAERVTDGIDATGQTDFYGLQALINRVHKVDGEVFGHPIMVAGEPRRIATTAIELIEGERVASPEGDSDRIREGVEIGARGQAIAMARATSSCLGLPVWSSAPKNQANRMNPSARHVRNGGDHHASTLHLRRRDPRRMCLFLRCRSVRRPGRGRRSSTFG